MAESNLSGRTWSDERTFDVGVLKLSYNADRNVWGIFASPDCVIRYAGHGKTPIEALRHLADRLEKEGWPPDDLADQLEQYEWPPEILGRVKKED